MGALAAAPELGAERTDVTQTGDVASAYDAFAPFYDAFTADYNHDSWMADVERWALESGLTGRRVLDVACGTGASFVPMLRRGYDVTACDISPAMVTRAREKIGPGGEVWLGDEVWLGVELGLGVGVEVVSAGAEGRTALAQARCYCLADPLGASSCRRVRSPRSRSSS